MVRGKLKESLKEKGKRNDKVVVQMHQSKERLSKKEKESSVKKQLSQQQLKDERNHQHSKVKTTIDKNSSSNDNNKYCLPIHPIQTTTRGGAGDSKRRKVGLKKKQKNVTKTSGLDHFHTQTLLRTSLQGKKLKPAKGTVNQKLTQLTTAITTGNSNNEEFAIPRSENPYTLKKLLDIYKNQFLETIQLMKSSEYHDQLMNQINVKNKTKEQLNLSGDHLNKHIDCLISDFANLLRTELEELNTPNENATTDTLISEAHNIVMRHREIQAELLELQEEVAELEREEELLVGDGRNELIEKCLVKLLINGVNFPKGELGKLCRRSIVNEIFETGRQFEAGKVQKKNNVQTKVPVTHRPRSRLTNYSPPPPLTPEKQQNTHTPKVKTFFEDQLKNFITSVMNDNTLSSSIENPVMPTLYPEMPINMMEKEHEQSLPPALSPQQQHGPTYYHQHHTTPPPQHIHLLQGPSSHHYTHPNHVPNSQYSGQNQQRRRHNHHHQPSHDPLHHDQVINNPLNPILSQERKVRLIQSSQQKNLGQSSNVPQQKKTVKLFPDITTVSHSIQQNIDSPVKLPLKSHMTTPPENRAVVNLSFSQTNPSGDKNTSNHQVHNEEANKTRNIVDLMVNEIESSLGIPRRSSSTSSKTNLFITSPDCAIKPYSPISRTNSNENISETLSSSFGGSRATVLVKPPMNSVNSTASGECVQSRHHHLQHHGQPSSSGGDDSLMNKGLATGLKARIISMEKSSAINQENRVDAGPSSGPAPSISRESSVEKGHQPSQNTTILLNSTTLVKEKIVVGSPNEGVIKVDLKSSDDADDMDVNKSDDGSASVLRVVRKRVSDPSNNAPVPHKKQSFSSSASSSNMALDLMMGPPKTPTPTWAPSTPSPRSGSVSSSRPGSAHYSGDGYATSVTPVSLGSNGYIQSAGNGKRVPTPTPIRGSPAIVESLGLNFPRSDSPTQQWQNKISNNFDRLFSFASEVDRRRKRTEANSSISPTQNGPNSTTPSSSSQKCSDVMDRSKTPSGTVDCTTSSDSGIGKDLLSAGLEGWIGPVSDRDPLPLSSLNGSEHSSSRSEKHRDMHSRSSKKSGYMRDSSIPRTPSPSRNEDIDEMDDPLPRIPTPGTGPNYGERSRRSSGMVKMELDGRNYDCDADERPATLNIRESRRSNSGGSSHGHRHHHRHHHREKKSSSGSSIHLSSPPPTDDSRIKLEKSETPEPNSSSIPMTPSGPEPCNHESDSREDAVMSGPATTTLNNCDNSFSSSSTVSPTSSTTVTSIAKTSSISSTSSVATTTTTITTSTSSHTASDRQYFKKIRNNWGSNNHTETVQQRQPPVQSHAPHTRSFSTESNITASYFSFISDSKVVYQSLTTTTAVTGSNYAQNNNNLSSSSNFAELQTSIQYTKATSFSEQTVKLANTDASNVSSIPVITGIGVPQKLRLKRKSYDCMHKKIINRDSLCLKTGLQKPFTNIPQQQSQKAQHHFQLTHHPPQQPPSSYPHSQPINGPIQSLKQEIHHHYVSPMQHQQRQMQTGSIFTAYHHSEIGSSSGSGGNPDGDTSRQQANHMNSTPTGNSYRHEHSQSNYHRSNTNHTQLPPLPPRQEQKLQPITTPPAFLIPIPPAPPTASHRSMFSAVDQVIIQSLNSNNNNDNNNSISNMEYLMNFKNAGNCNVKPQKNADLQITNVKYKSPFYLDDKDEPLYPQKQQQQKMIHQSGHHLRHYQTKHNYCSYSQNLNHVMLIRSNNDSARSRGSGRGYDHNPFTNDAAAGSYGAPSQKMHSYHQRPHNQSYYNGAE